MDITGLGITDTKTIRRMEVVREMPEYKALAESSNGDRLYEIFQAIGARKELLKGGDSSGSFVDENGKARDPELIAADFKKTQEMIANDPELTRLTQESENLEIADLRILGEQYQLHPDEDMKDIGRNVVKIADSYVPHK